VVDRARTVPIATATKVRLNNFFLTACSSLNLIDPTGPDTKFLDDKRECRCNSFVYYKLYIVKAAKRLDQAEGLPDVFFDGGQAYQEQAQALGCDGRNRKRLVP
jgi:hypothetical protein